MEHVETYGYFTLGSTGNLTGKLGSRPNASILSRLLEHQERTGDIQGAEATKKIAPIAWQNINLQGRFAFLKQPDALHVDAIIRALISLPSHHALTSIA